MSQLNSAFDVVKLVLKAMEHWRSFTPDRRAWVFSHILVPALIAPFTIYPLVPGGSLPSGDGKVAVAPLHSRVAIDGTVEQHQGLAMIIDPAAPRFSVSVSPATPGVLTSLRADHARNTRSSFEIYADSIGIDPSRIGVDSPLVVVAEGTPGSTVYFGSSQYPMKTVAVAAQPVSSLPFAVVLCAVFGVGLAAGTEYRGA